MTANTLNFSHRDLTSVAPIFEATSAAQEMIEKRKKDAHDTLDSAQEKKLFVEGVMQDGRVGFTMKQTLLAIRYGGVIDGEYVSPATLAALFKSFPDEYITYCLSYHSHGFEKMLYTLMKQWEEKIAHDTNTFLWDTERKHGEQHPFDTEWINEDYIEAMEIFYSHHIDLTENERKFFMDMLGVIRIFHGYSDSYDSFGGILARLDEGLLRALIKQKVFTWEGMRKTTLNDMSITSLTPWAIEALRTQYAEELLDYIHRHHTQLIESLPWLVNAHYTTQLALQPKTYNPEVHKQDTFKATTLAVLFSSKRPQ